MCRLVDVVAAGRAGWGDLWGGPQLLLHLGRTGIAAGCPSHALCRMCVSSLLDIGPWMPWCSLWGHKCVTPVAVGDGFVRQLLAVPWDCCPHLELQCLAGSVSLTSLLVVGRQAVTAPQLCRQPGCAMHAYVFRFGCRVMAIGWLALTAASHHVICMSALPLNRACACLSCLVWRCRPS